MAACTLLHRRRLCVTCHCHPATCAGGEFGCTLWKLHLAAHADEGEAPGPSSPSPDKLLEPLATMPQPKGRVRRCVG